MKIKWEIGLTKSEESKRTYNKWSNPRVVVHLEKVHTVINKTRIVVLDNNNEFSASSHASINSHWKYMVRR